ncbi:hypothetical protein [Microvirga terricola]|uniref:Uncharacterized protein n=1 Tax=Microvirga terricola TaxID=2719797 RepID=A0ABX0V7M2_9HYPH|nr:hypothetical protein [Microvirga terricola]NIX75199.1 hypothetical protein [Microvirga terricola]
MSAESLFSAGTSASELSDISTVTTPKLSTNQRFVILNRLVSRSKTRAPQEHHAPTLGLLELAQILDMRRKNGWAIEYLNSLDDDDEKVRASNGQGHDFIWLRDLSLQITPEATYVIFLIEFVDQRQKSFSVVHTKNLMGRDIAGVAEERGASSAHVVVRVPSGDAYEDGSYRCAIESVPSGVSRKLLEIFLCRQLRRYAKATELTFSVTTHKRGKKPKEVSYRYSPQIQLMADVGRKLGALATQQRTLSQMVFTKRSEKKTIAGATDVIHQDILTDIEVRVSAKQAPADSEEKRSWISSIIQTFEMQGYDTKLYYRHIGGGLIAGEIHQDLDGAADLLICPKEIIFLSQTPRRWHSTVCGETVAQMKALVDRDALWECAT